MKSICLIILSSLFFISSVSATGGRKSTEPVEKPSLEVTFLGVDGDFLLFTVKAEKVAPKTFFTIRNEAGDEIYRELHNEINSMRRIRIPRLATHTLRFVLGSRKQQCVKTFTINTNIVETIQVKEIAR
jgi:hypothetical protein